MTGALKRLAPLALLGAACLATGYAGAGQAPDANPLGASPMFSAPGRKAIEPDAPLPRKPNEPPGDVAFGAYQRGYFITALREAEKRVVADAHDAAAMTLLGEIHRDGLAVKQDLAEAARWYRIASNLGDPQAAFQLGVLLLDGGPGLPKDKALAKAQFEKAAAKGLGAAAYNLGVLAIEGDETEKPDFEKAAAYFKQAAEQGDQNGAYSYAILLRQGKGVALDVGESARWLKRAADAGIIAGQVEYAIMLFNGVGVEKDEAGAARIFKLAAARKNPIAQNRLAHLYVSGRGVPKDLTEALVWHSFAKAAGVEDAALEAETANLPPEQVKRAQEEAHRLAEF